MPLAAAADTSDDDRVNVRLVAAAAAALGKDCYYEAVLEPVGLIAKAEDVGFLGDPVQISKAENCNGDQFVLESG